MGFRLWGRTESDTTEWLSRSSSSIDIAMTEIWAQIYNSNFYLVILFYILDATKYNVN